MHPASKMRTLTVRGTRAPRSGPIRFGWLLAGCLTVGTANAGFYAGYQENEEENRIAFAGMMLVGESRFYELFAARLEYRYDNGGEVRADQFIFTPSVGLRWEDGWSISGSVGPSFVSREEEGARTEDNDSIGLTFKASVVSAPGPFTHELLASFTTIDRVLWSRARIRRALWSHHFTIGGEIVGMSAEQANSYGAGLLFDLSGGPGRLGIVVGYERSTNRENAAYGGIELSAFF
jgi:hypothetical protein